MSRTLMQIKKDVAHGKLWNGKVRTEIQTKNQSNDKIRNFHLTENASLVDLDVSEKIVAITKLTLPNDDGPIEASSTIDGIPNSAFFNRFESVEMAQPKCCNDDSEHKKSEKSEKSDSSVTTQCTLATIKESELQVPTAPPLSDDMASDPSSMFDFQMRQHEFTNRTVLRSESCTHCLKK